jgi:hypothetical protein
MHSQNNQTGYESPQAVYSPDDYSSPAEPAEKPKNKLPFGVIAAASSLAVVALFIFVGAGIYLLKSSNDAAGKVLASDKNNTNKSSAVVVPSAAARQIKIDVDEGKAHVYRGGESIGSTPLDLTVQDGEKLDLTLRRDGFEDKAVKFEAVGGKRVYTFSLKQK